MVQIVVSMLENAKKSEKVSNISCDPCDVKSKLPPVSRNEKDLEKLPKETNKKDYTKM